MPNLGGYFSVVAADLNVVGIDVQFPMVVLIGVVSFTFLSYDFRTSHFTMRMFLPFKRSTTRALSVSLRTWACSSVISTQ